MSAPSPAPVNRITRLGESAASSLAGAFTAGSVAEVTHLPGGVPSSRMEVVELAPGDALDRAAMATDLLLHIVAGAISAGDLHDGPVVQAGAGESLLVPAGIAFRVVAGASNPVQLLLVRGD